MGNFQRLKERGKYCYWWGHVNSDITVKVAQFCAVADKYCKDTKLFEPSVTPQWVGYNLIQGLLTTSTFIWNFYETQEICTLICQAYGEINHGGRVVIHYHWTLFNKMQMLPPHLVTLGRKLRNEIIFTASKGTKFSRYSYLYHITSPFHPKA